VAESDECLAAEVRDEEGQPARAERLGQALAEDVDGRTGASSTAASSAPRSSPADGCFFIGAPTPSTYRDARVITRRTESPNSTGTPRAARRIPQLDRDLAR
jgi:hypothetical protein